MALLLIVLFTRQKFNWGPLLDFSMVIAMLDKILQENLTAEKIAVHKVHFC